MILIISNSSNPVLLTLGESDFQIKTNNHHWLSPPFSIKPKGQNLTWPSWTPYRWSSGCQRSHRRRRVHHVLLRNGSSHGKIRRPAKGLQCPGFEAHPFLHQAAQLGTESASKLVSYIMILIIFRTIVQLSKMLCKSWSFLRSVAVKSTQVSFEISSFAHGPNETQNPTSFFFPLCKNSLMAQLENGASACITF